MGYYTIPKESLKPLRHILGQQFRRTGQGRALGALSAKKHLKRRSRTLTQLRSIYIDR